MKVTGTADVGGGPDVLAFDTSLRRLYVAAESGEVAVFAAGTGRLTKLGQALLGPRAHTVAVDSRPHLVYFPLETGSAGAPELRIMAPTTATKPTPPSGGGTTQTTTPVAPPARPGAWKQIGASVTSAPGKPLHFYRTVQDPKALGFVVTSPSPNTINVDYTSYCEFSSDDDKTLDDNGTLTGVQTVTGYPATFDGATLCYVSVSARPTGTATVAAAIFATY